MGRVPAAVIAVREQAPAEPRAVQATAVAESQALEPAERRAAAPEPEQREPVQGRPEPAPAARGMLAQPSPAVPVRRASGRGRDEQQTCAGIPGGIADRLGQRGSGQKRGDQHDVLDFVGRQGVAQSSGVDGVSPGHSCRTQPVTALGGALPSAQDHRDHLIGRSELSAVRRRRSRLGRRSPRRGPRLRRAPHGPRLVPSTRQVRSPLLPPTSSQFLAGPPEVSDPAVLRQPRTRDAQRG